MLVIENPLMVKVGYTNKLTKEGERTSDIAKDHNAIAAINGGGLMVWNARTAIGQRKDGAILLLVVDGRRINMPVATLHFIKNMDFSKIVNEDYNLSAALGGLTYGVTPVEMASGYSTLARGGEFIDPTCIRSIMDSQGKTIYQNKMEKRRVYTDDASYLMTDILKGCINNEIKVLLL